MTYTEPNIVINGTTLSMAEAMTLRVALNSFLTHIQEDGLGDDETGKAIAKGYLAHGRSCLRLMMKE